MHFLFFRNATCMAEMNRLATPASSTVSWTSVTPSYAPIPLIASADPQGQHHGLEDLTWVLYFYHDFFIDFFLHKFSVGEVKIEHLTTLGVSFTWFLLIFMVKENDIYWFSLQFIFSYWLKITAGACLLSTSLFFAYKCEFFNFSLSTLELDNFFFSLRVNCTFLLT